MASTSPRHTPRGSEDLEFRDERYVGPLKHIQMPVFLSGCHVECSAAEMQGFSGRLRHRANFYVADCAYIGLLLRRVLRLIDGLCRIPASNLLSYHAGNSNNVLTLPGIWTRSGIPKSSFCAAMVSLDRIFVGAPMLTAGAGTWMVRYQDFNALRPWQAT